MKIIEADSSAFLKNNKRIQILLREKGEIHRHCDAIVLEENGNDFLILCASPCPPALGRTYHLQREGFQHPSEVSLREESTLKIKEKIFGYCYSGSFI